MAELNTFCALCRMPAPLVQSHILPAFVFRWLRETSATGHIRFGTAPNKRVQDGIKVGLLCSDCEKRLNAFETPFARDIFHPWDGQSVLTIPYGDWLLKFCASVSWRILKHFASQTDHLSHLSNEQRLLAGAAFDRWADVLLGREMHPARFEQHLLPLGPIDSHSVPDLPNNINRYFMRAVDMDVATGDHCAFTYAKIGKFAIFGFIEPPPKKKKWVGTKVHVRGGTIRPQQYILPAELLDYISGKARRYAELQSQISEKQVEKIDRDAMRGFARFRGSDTLTAMLHDRRLFGEEAILRKPKQGKKND